MEIPASYDRSILSHFRRILIAEKVAVIEKLQQKVSPDFMDELNSSERIDRSQILERHGVAVTTEREHLVEIGAALLRCKDGTYGLCPDCGQLILLDRLKIVPTASRCVPCQAKHKSNGKPRGKSVSLEALDNPLMIFTAKKDVRVPRRVTA